MKPRHVTLVAVASYVRRHPGLTCLEIATLTDIEPPVVRLALADGRKAGRLRSEGNTRGTKWFHTGARG